MVDRWVAVSLNGHQLHRPADSLGARARHYQRTRDLSGRVREYPYGVPCGLHRHVRWFRVPRRSLWDPLVAKRIYCLVVSGEHGPRIFQGPMVAGRTPVSPGHGGVGQLHGGLQSGE